MKKLLLIALISISNCQFSIVHAQCGEALKAYAKKYPAAEAQDLYKLVFQDLYGPGHLITDSAACARYIGEEVAGIKEGPWQFPLYEYTLCDSNFVRVNLVLVKYHVISLERLVSAVMRSAEGIESPDSKFVMTHSTAFKAAYDPHYRIVRRDIYEREFRAVVDDYLRSIKGTP